MSLQGLPFPRTMRARASLLSLGVVAPFQRPHYV
jgi:hypothetical protein